jgi:hypothetical protein
MLARDTSRTPPFQAAAWIVLACAACIVGHPASAMEPGTPSATALSGTYEHVPGQSSDISQAIDAAVKNMSFIKRPIARGRLAKTNVPYQRIRIELTGTEVEIAFDDRKPIRMPLDGQPIKWTREDGEVFDVSVKLDGDELVQTYRAEDGMRVNTFQVDASGALRLKVEVSSPQLPQPMRYELAYRRL